MKELNLECPSCEHAIYKQRLKPVYADGSEILGIQGVLNSYEYICPFCKGEFLFDKDYVRDFWKQENPGKKTALKL